PSPQSAGGFRPAITRHYDIARVRRRVSSRNDKALRHRLRARGGFVPLIVPERHHRIDFRRPPRPDTASQHRHANQQRSHRDEGPRIALTDPVKIAGQKAGQGQRRRHPKNHSYDRKPQPFAKNQSRDIGPSGAQRHADADFARSLADRQRQHSIKTDGAEQQRHSARITEDSHRHPDRRKVVLNYVCQWQFFADGDIRIYRQNLTPQQRERRLRIAFQPHHHAIAAELGAEDERLRRFTTPAEVVVSDHADHFVRFILEHHSLADRLTIRP